MDVKQAYNIWAAQYDTNSNRTRELEAISLRKTLANTQFVNCLEIGCGTGKNTEWLLTKAKQVIAVDFSEEMLTKARHKINADNVLFIQADINSCWNFTNQKFDLVTFSLVLEHIENLNEIFHKVAEVIKVNCIVYVGELHPFKQYTGTQARFDTAAGPQIVTGFMHNISDFTHAAKNNDFEILDISEYFDDDDISNIPRILTILLRKR